MENREKIANALLLLRLCFLLLFFCGTVEKFLNPGLGGGLFYNFYGLGGLGSTVFMVIGALELLLLIGFVSGFKKRITYGLVFLIHAVSTLSTWQQLINPFEGPNLLFYAGVPMLAACWALYSLRDLDTRLTID